MITGIHAAASGLHAQQARLDTLSNDLANVNTTGYKSQRFQFGELLYQERGQNRASQAGSDIGVGVAGQVLDRDFRGGSITRTDQPLDLAVDGQGFFAVQAANGQTLLTRDGSFRLDSTGQVVTSTGERLVPALRLDGDLSKVSIGQNGDVRQNGQLVGRVTVHTVAVPQRLQSVGDSLFAPTDDSGAAEMAADGRVQQGALEGSNVDVSQAMASMIETQRAYEMASRSVRTWDEVLQAAVQIRR